MGSISGTASAAILGIGLLSAALQPAVAATETPLYRFKIFPDAIQPDFGVVAAADGSLYGVTRQGGTGPGEGNGTIYRVVPPVAGKTAWTESVVWNFKGGAQGKWPEGPLVLGGDGNFYGTTITGGDMTDCKSQGCGTAFSFTPPLPGKKLGKLVVIHRFHSVAGSSPTGALTFDNTGNLYGATQFGGGDNYCTGDAGGCGVIFRLTPPAPGKVAWEQFTLYRFQHQVGAVPNGGLIWNASQTTLYGTAEGGGTNSLAGVVFSLSKPAPGHAAWSYAVLHNFLGGTGSSSADGSQPFSGLAFDNAGNLYGSTEIGGSKVCNSFSGCGIVFELSPAGPTWNYTILHTFAGGSDGRNPYSGFTFDGTALYGTASSGGNTSCGGSGCGTVYKIVPGTTPTYSTVWAFQNTSASDGAVPHYASLLWNGASTFYGTTWAGGALTGSDTPWGTVYSLTVP